MSTPDDGFRNFHDHAWPILAECDFNAENFIVTDRVGGSAAWDGEDGRQQPLMDWSEIKVLSRSGARFGSHLATHRYADGLSGRELVAEGSPFARRPGGRSSIRRYLAGRTFRQPR